MLVDNLWGSRIRREAGMYEKEETKMIPPVCGKTQYSKILKCAGSLKTLGMYIYASILIRHTYISTYICMCM